MSSSKGRTQSGRGGGNRTPPPVKRTGSSTGTRQPARSGGTQPIPGAPTRPARRPDAPPRREAPPRTAGATRRDTSPRPDAFARRNRNRRIGVWTGIGALVAVVVASAVGGQLGGTTTAARQAPSSSAAPRTATVAAGTHAVAAPVAPTTTAAPPSPLAMTCPSTNVSSPVFGHDITAPAPYRVTIHYGDGDTYTNDSAHLGAIFSHTYKARGSYTVTAVLTDATGRTSTASCVYDWARAATGTP